MPRPLKGTSVLNTNTQRNQPFDPPRPVGPEPEPLPGATPVVIMNGQSDVLLATHPVSSIVPALPGPVPVGRTPNNGLNIYVPHHLA